MFLGRFRCNNYVFYGKIGSDGEVYEVEDLFNQVKTGKKYSLHELEALSPCQPTKIICVGLNYRDHAEELGLPIPEEPLLFLKPPTALTPHNSPIVYPKLSRQVDYEGELAVVIGKTISEKIIARKANKYILGYTCANDITARDLQNKDGQWTRAKSFDTFLPLGPYINTEVNLKDTEISTYVNGELRQHSNTSNLIFSVEELISFISNIMTLLPGDVIITGTPSGIGPLKIGDEVKVKIQNIGSLENYIISI